MTKIAAAISRFLTTRDNGTFARSEDAFNRYLAVSLLIHFVVIVVLSVSYARSIRPVIPAGPYEVSLIQMEEPKPKPEATQRAVPKKPQPKPPQPKPKAVVPEKKKEEDAVKIKPEAKKPEPKKPAETAQEKPETPAPAPESLLAAETGAPSPSSVSGFQVDNPNFNFNYYLATLRDKIQSNWRPPSGLPAMEGGYSAVVRFTIRRDGAIIGADVEESSGLRFFDQSALRAVVNSNPAPPLPRAYDEDRLGVHVSFVFSEESR